MDDTGALQTWEILMELGFRPDAQTQGHPVLRQPDMLDLQIPGDVPLESLTHPLVGEEADDENSRLSFDFGNFQLTAICAMNRHFAQIILLGGVMVKPRAVALVDFEMPREVSSKEQCVAWITWNLDQAAGRERFVPRNPVEWIELGRQNKHLLPWVYPISPIQTPHAYCVVPRDWLRLAWKELTKRVESTGVKEQIVFECNDEILRISHDGSTVAAIPAEGGVWASAFEIVSDAFGALPKRFKEEKVSVSVFDTYIQIGDLRYGLVDKEVKS